MASDVAKDTLASRIQARAPRPEGHAPPPESLRAWQDALLAAQLLRAAGPALGGLWLKARAGGVRDTYLDHLKTCLGAEKTWIRVPGSAAHSTLTGSIDIPATAKAGRVVALPGLLERADGGVLVLPMAERMEPSTAALIGNALETGTLPLAAASADRGLFAGTRFQVIALDEAASAEERLPPALGGRLSLRVDLNPVAWSAVSLAQMPEAAAADWRKVDISGKVMELFSAIACAAGYTSLRCLSHLARVSRLLAALEARASVEEADALAALRLCLGLALDVQPAPQDEALPEDIGQADSTQCETGPGSPAPAAPRPQEGTQEQSATEDPAENQSDPNALSELLAAVEAGAIDGLPEFSASSSPRTGSTRTGKAGASARAARRGRPVSTAHSAPYPDARPNIIATLRAAAPWQLIRNRNRAALLTALKERGTGMTTDRPKPRARPQDKQHRALITRDDYRYQRLRHETPSTAIFMVDASGSTALERLGETKGAIEHLLARCYVRRDEVAMIAFRGRSAEMVLPPTRSLVLAKRRLAGLPGGGPTPLASGLEKGLELGLSVRRQGSTPVMVLLTDGRGNIALNGEPDRARARQELDLVASKYRSLDLRAICIDIARRPRGTVASLAETMGADLHFLQHANASAVSQVVDASLVEARG